MKRSLAMVLALLALSTLACGESGSDSPTTGDDANVTAGTKEKKAGGEVSFGSYRNKFPEAGEILSLELKARTANMPKKFHGSFVRTDKTSGADKRLEGFFQISKRVVKNTSVANGTKKITVMTFFDGQKKKIDEFQAFEFLNALVIATLGEDPSEHFLEFEKTASGQQVVTLDLNCDVTDVNQSVNPFEEGLVAVGDGDEDSDAVSFKEVLGKLEVDIGQMSFSHAGGDTIKMVRRSGNDFEVLVDIDETDKIRLTVERGKGKMTFEAGSKKDPLGEFKCK
jgi:hypothetical protein